MKRLLLVFVTMCSLCATPVYAAEYVLYQYFKIRPGVACLTITAQADASGDLVAVTIPPGPPKWAAGQIIHAIVHPGPYTSTHTGDDDSDVLIDSSAHWRPDQLAESETTARVETPQVITNTTNSETATVISNSRTTAEGTLSGGESWDTDDAYSCGPTATPSGTYNIVLTDWNGIPVFGDGSSGTDALAGLATGEVRKIEPYNAYTLISGPLTFDLTGTVGANNGAIITIFWLIR